VNIVINGYGRMGKLIRQTALSRGHRITAIIDPFESLPEVTGKELTSAIIKDSDVVVDFTVPQTAVKNISIIAEAGVSAVIGTTGWYNQEEEVRALVERAGTGLIWSGNFSPGVNLLFQIIRNTGQIMNNFPEYDVMIHEFHHAGKADSPSGTAEMLSSVLIDTIDRKNRKVTESLQRRIEPDELHVSSTRGGSIPGTHTIVFDSGEDTIEITHRARNRMGFALGAVSAAEWIAGKSGYFSIDDMMNSILKQN